MSLKREDLYPHVRNRLQHWYPDNRGWKIYDRHEISGIQPDFLIEKKTGNSIERSVCAVETVPVITEDHIRRFNHLIDALSGNNISILEKILVVPAGTNTSCVPSGFSIIHLPETNNE